ncbi:MAG: hypothetical protein HY269_07080 [Deltaproteobacteria bacterium]|nr:hypothetical protein [Deltaproteobacteria bacterium]
MGYVRAIATGMLILSSLGFTELARSDERDLGSDLRLFAMASGKPWRPQTPLRRETQMAQGCQPGVPGYCGQVRDIYYCCPDRYAPIACFNYRGTGRVVCMTAEATGNCAYILQCWR